MSVTVMAAVWQLDLPQNQKLVLLAFADHADDDGRSAFPSIDRVAWKTGFSPRSVQRVVSQLREHGLLVVEGIADAGTTLYRVAVEGGDKLTPFDEWRKTNGRKPRGDTGDARGATDRRPGGDMGDAPGATPVSPKPSVTHPESSDNHQRDEASQNMTEGLFQLEPVEKTPATRPLDPYWETMKQIWEEPHTNRDPERGRWNKLIQLVKEQGHPPEEIARRVVIFLTVWPSLPFPTVSALWSRWTHLGSAAVQMSAHDRQHMVKRLQQEHWDDAFIAAAMGQTGDNQ